MSSLSGRTLRSLAVTLLFIWLGCAVYVVLEQIAGRLTYRNFDIDPLARIHWITLFYWLPWVFFAPCVAFCSARFPLRPAKWSFPLSVHLVLLLLLALVHGLSVGFIYAYSPMITPYMATFEPWQHSGHFLFGDHMFLYDTIFYAVLAATLNIRNFQQIVRQQELDASRLNQHLAELRFQALRMQVNPHFLFNALNSISVLVRKGQNDRATQAIGLLSRVFRHTLESSDRQWVALEEELEIVRQYLALAQLRFGSRLRVHEHCAPALWRVAVPAMLLQPLIENAVSHGLSEKVGPCELSLLCTADGGKLRIEIADNGIGGRFYGDPDFEEGIGLANVRARLEQMYGDSHAFTLHGAPGKGTRVVIVLPVEPTASWSVAV